MKETNRNNPPMRHGGPMGHMGGGPPQKAKNFKGTLMRLVSYLSPQKFKFFIVVVLAIGSTVFSIVGPKIMGTATNKLAEGFMKMMMGKQKAEAFDMHAIATILLWLLGLYLISSLLTYVTGLIMSDVAQKTVYNMRNDVKAKLDKLPLKYFDTRTHGEILSRVTNDMDTIANTLQQSLTQLITSPITIIGILVMMLSINVFMTLIALFTLPLSFVFVIAITKRSQKFFSQQQKEIGNLNGHVEEMFTAHKIVKVFEHENEAIKEFDEINDRYFQVGWKAQFVSGLIQPTLNFVSNLGYVLVCIVGGVLVAKKSINVGDVQAFIQYMRSFTMPIIQTANIANIIQSTIAAAERVFEVLDENEEIPDNPHSITIPSVIGNVAFEHVKFGYNEDNILMQDIDITVNAGDTIAIVGPTGAGKTTLINLLMRFYEVNSGKIKIDGVDITDLKRSDLRKCFGMVLQDTWLFNGTILENIKYAGKDATDEDVFKSAKSAYAHRFIRALPEGYNTILNEDATNISQGQKQLITIARALLTDPSILILDEATSNVDTRTEILIQQAMDKLMEGRTSFVIAHRLSTIKNADLILVMDKGTIIEKGTHEQLMAKNGFYAELYNSQFSDGE